MPTATHTGVTEGTTSARAGSIDLFTFLLAGLVLEQTPGTNMAYLATLALMRWLDRDSRLLRGFLSNAFNPKSILFFVSVLPTFIGTGLSAPSLPAQMAVFGILCVGIATSVHGTCSSQHTFSLGLWRGHDNRNLRRVFSVVLALVAIWLAWTTRH